ncbi:MAG: hypothetical protein KGR26_02850 [Cyanobacteria bacterium REEB65]|nr:hypothetical protein [Cyanobacteria bacterium REEB65]
MKAALALLLLGLWAWPARASTMPAADFQPGTRTVGVGVGFGGGLSVDAALTPNLLAGLSTSWLASPPVGGRFDAHVLYQFVNGGKTGLSIAGIVGLWGDTSLPGGPFPYLPPIEGGFGLAYPFTPRLVGRLNLVVPLFKPTRPFDIFGGPAAGLELGYRFRPNLEGTLGLNGQGNLLGARFVF